MPLSSHSADALTLASKQPFAQGNHRQCFAIRERSDLCFKVELGNYRLYQRLRSPNVAELRYHKHLRVASVDISALPVSHAYSIQTIDGYRGLLCDLIRDHDGAISETAKHYARKGMSSGQMEAIRELYRKIIECRLLIKDPGVGNIVLQDRGGERWKAVFVDGLGPSTLIPVAQFSRTVQERASRAKAVKILQRLGVDL